MDRTWKHVCLVFWIYFLYLYGIYLFASGFLLNRVVIERKSNREDLVRFFNKTSEIVHRHCEVRSDSILYKLPLISRVCREPFRNEFGNEIRREDPCVFKKRFSRAVMIILDGLRYDFTIYQENGTVSGSDRGNRHLFENKLPVFQELKQKHPTGSVLYPFIADPPTTTLQRLKGLMTGSLPTFIDVSANFASYEISEDNLIDQMHSNGKKIVFMGDDTWKGLFPKKFHRSYFYPSFNVKDLHTVDDGIIKHLIPEMERKDWDIIIAHFLGIDHCGHRFGPSHPEMTRKLAKINSIISSVASLISNDTVLLVFGDHGMTSSGDHGGDSRDELTSALFIYTPSKLFDEHPADYLELVHQVDLVPTISFFLGLPIPFSSLGSVIPSLFYVSTSFGIQDQEFKELMSLSAATEILMINTIQVQQYLEVYFTNPDRETQSEFLEAENLLIEVNKTWSDLCALSDFRKLNEARNKLETIHNGYFRYLKTIKKICDRKWATFDLFLMTNGLIVLTVTTVFCFVFMFLSEKVESDISYLLQFAGVSLILAICLYLMDISFLSKMFNTGNVTLYITVFLVLLPSLFYCTKFVCYQKNFVFNQFTVSLLIFPYFVSFFSNSYVVHEDKCCQYLLQSCLITRLTNKPRTCEKYKPSLDLVFLLTEALELLLLMGSVRCGSLFWKCREEQFLCISSLLPSQLSSFPADYKTLHLFPACVSLLFTVGFFYWLLYRCLYFSTETASGLCLLYAVPSMTVAIVMYWIAGAVPGVVAERVFKGKQEILPQIVYMLASLSLGVVWISPLPVSNMKSTPENMAKLRTVYSSSLLMFCLIILVVSFLLTGDEFSSSLCFLVVGAALYVKRSPDFTMNNEGNLRKFHLPSSVILTWVLFSCHGFFVTGHQCTFPSIHWQAAFVGNSGEFSTNLIPGFLVAFNTFSSYLMFGLSLPLLVTWTVGKHTVFKSQKDKQSTDQGELTLFKAPAEFRRGLLRLSVQYIVLHGLKLLASSAACALHRRHLMVWKIFAPRLIFEAVAMGVTMFGMVLGYLFTLRVHFAVRRWLEHIFHNKSLEFGAVEYGKLSMRS